MTPLIPLVFLLAALASSSPTEPEEKRKRANKKAIMSAVKFRLEEKRKRASKMAMMSAARFVMFVGQRRAQMRAHIERLTRGRPHAAAFLYAAQIAERDGNDRWLRDMLYRAAARGWTVERREGIDSIADSPERQAVADIVGGVVATALASGEVELLHSELRRAPPTCVQHGDPIPSGHAGIDFDSPGLAYLTMAIDEVTGAGGGTTGETKCAAARRQIGARLREIPWLRGHGRDPARVADLAIDELAGRENAPMNADPPYLVSPPTMRPDLRAAVLRHAGRLP